MEAKKVVPQDEERASELAFAWFAAQNEQDPELVERIAAALHAAEVRGLARAAEIAEGVPAYEDDTGYGGVVAMQDRIVAAIRAAMEGE